MKNPLNKENVSAVIKKFFKGEFDSHEFIEKFASEFEADYIDMLCEHKGDDAFRKVHSKIGAFLRDNSDALEICKKQEDGNCTGKVSSENIFGNFNDVQKWKNCSK